MSQSKKRGPGRPTKGDKAMMTPIAIRFPPAMLEAIEAIQAERLDAPEKAAVVRELVAEALAARAKRSKQ